MAVVVSAADESRTNAMATHRAIKAVRIYFDIGLMIGHPPTPEDIRSMNAVGRDAAVRSAGVKVASEGTWKVVEAIAIVFEGLSTREAAEALPVDGRGRKRPSALPPVCQVPGCGCTGDAHP